VFATYENNASTSEMARLNHEKSLVELAPCFLRKLLEETVKLFGQVAIEIVTSIATIKTPRMMMAAIFGVLRS